MDRIAVFVDDADHARKLLEPMLGQKPDGTTWLVVMCAPKLTHRIGRWVSNRSREQWRERWSARLRQELAPVFTRPDAGPQVEWMLARGPLQDLTRQLRTRLGAGLAVLDARRPKLGQPMMPVDPTQAAAAESERWKGPVAVSGSLSIMLALTD
jgi:hypothetical protein